MEGLKEGAEGTNEISTHQERVARVTCTLMGWHGSQTLMNPPLPCRTHTHTHTDLSDFSRGDLPFIGTSKHTGDVPVGKEEGTVSARLGPLANRAGAGWLFDRSPC